VFGEAETDKHGPDLRHGTYRDRHFLAAPHVPCLQEHMGYLVAARFYGQPLDLPYLAVGRTDGQFAAYVYRAGGDGVDPGLLRGFRLGRPGRAFARPIVSRANATGVAICATNEPVRSA
jgi:hypothetical protein